jgi:uracil-DNA glycosylase family 4
MAAMDWTGAARSRRGLPGLRPVPGRTQTVFGVGDLQADWMVVGEAPGEHEDLQGEPFVGQAGKLLDNMLKAIGLTVAPAHAGQQKGVYIANVLKCRPPGNRNPQPDEVAQCEPYLRAR